LQIAKTKYGTKIEKYVQCQKQVDKTKAKHITEIQKWHNQRQSETCVHGRRQRGQGGVPLLDFQTWYKYSR